MEKHVMKDEKTTWVITPETKIDIFTLSVTQEGEKVTDEFELFYTGEKAELWGLALSSDQEQMPFYRGTIEIRLNSNEVIPEHYDARLLQSGINVSPGERFQFTKLPVGNGTLDVRYQDVKTAFQRFSPYTLKLYALLYQPIDQ